MSQEELIPPVGEAVQHGSLHINTVTRQPSDTINNCLVCSVAVGSGGGRQAADAIYENTVSGSSWKLNPTIVSSLLITIL